MDVALKGADAEAHDNEVTEEDPNTEIVSTFAEEIAAVDTPWVTTARTELAPSEMRLLLRLDEALRAPELGSPELPTTGSAGHHYGTCKPCAFFHRKGCFNGVDCRFCHLCGPRERKARLQKRWTDQYSSYSG
eukprot:UN0541